MGKSHRWRASDPAVWAQRKIGAQTVSEAVYLSAKQRLKRSPALTNRAGSLLENNCHLAGCSR